MMRDYVRMVAGYNCWANARLYELLWEEYVRDRRGFFRSIHGTLNHLLVADRIWLARITGGPIPATALDAILYEELPVLRAARKAEDKRIVTVVDALDENALSARLAYRTTRGEAFEQPVGQVLAHIFNHQTHHRGQVHDMLSQTGMAPPPLDLIYYLRSL